jgi:hypothetical protein
VAVVVECPACLWPTVLEERGPSEDPSILLTGTARIGGARARIVAIRVNSTQEWTPDFRRGVAEDTYHENDLDEVLQTVLEEFQTVASELGDLLGDSDPSVVELATGHYSVWVIPTSFGS